MIQILHRAAIILQSLEGHPEGRSLAEIANEVGLPRSTVHRIVKSLQEDHLISSATPTAGFRLGPAVMRLASLSNQWFTTLVHEHLRELSRVVDETVDLSVRSGNVVLFIDQITLTVTHRLQAVSRIGASFPLHCTAPGKALLADLPPDELNDLLIGPLERFTPNTMTRSADLIADVKSIRARGFAVDREEHHLGICAVGTAIHNPFGLAAALSIPAPISRFDGRADELAEALMAARASIEAAIAG
ncbi:MAG: IclR family transcriptional regulator [Ilumatobacteraceae bacterium]